jgi:hypothetical protein
VLKARYSGPLVDKKQEYVDDILENDKGGHVFFLTEAGIFENQGTLSRWSEFHQTGIHTYPEPGPVKMKDPPPPLLPSALTAPWIFFRTWIKCAGG